MSKASEWAKKQPRDLSVGNHCAFVVIEKGKPVFRLDNAELTATEAIALAHWILSTFTDTHQ